MSESTMMMQSRRGSGQKKRGISRARTLLYFILSRESHVKPIGQKKKKENEKKKKISMKNHS